MAKYLIIWEIDTIRLPESPEERIRQYTVMVNVVKEDLKRGKTLDWGMFAGGELGGYAICEGTEQEITIENWKYLPYITFKTYPILSVNQVAEMLTHVSG
jgi:hypothetical protein